MSIKEDIELVEEIIPDGEDDFCDSAGIVKSLSRMPNSKLIKDISVGKDIKGFEKHLRNRNLSENTISGWVSFIKSFYENFNVMNKINLLAHKSYLIENYAPKTVNMRISGINAYIKYWHEESEDAKVLRLLLKNIKIQQKTFLDNVITLQQYKQLCDFLKKNINKETEGRLIYNINKNVKKETGKQLIMGTERTSFQKAYIIVRCLGLTGVRVSELVKFNTQAVKMGYFDVLGKGGKVRRIFIPKKLQQELEEYIADQKLEGYLFVNKKGEAVTTRGIAHFLKGYADLCGIPRDVMYPHSFRHMFAKSFLAKRCDIALLSDLLGHSNIETTRIYLRLTSAEQKEIVDKIVDW